MARLAEFIGGVHFSSESISPNLAELNTENQSESNAGHQSGGLRVRIVNTGGRDRNDENSEREERNSNPSTEFRIRTIVNGVEQRSNSHEDHEAPSNEAAGSSSERNEGSERSNNESNASRLVDIIQLLGSVAGSGSGALRIRRRDTRPNESSPHISPSNQNNDPRVPGSQSPVGSGLVSTPSEQNDSRIQPGASRNNDTEEQPNTRRRSNLGQQGFIIFPPDPRNVGRGPSILYFGGSGDNAADRAALPNSQNDSQNVSTSSAESSSSQNSLLHNSPTASSHSYNAR